MAPLDLGAGALGAYLSLLLERAGLGHGDSDRHALTLLGLAVGRRGRRYLELGVRDGATTLPLLLGAYLVDGYLISVDVAPTRFVPPDALEEHWIFRQQDSLNYLNDTPPGTCFDLVYIDDCHHAEHVAQELKMLDPLVSPRSLILIHDTMYGQSPCYHSDPQATGTWAGGGPYAALTKLDPNLWEWATVPYGHGLTLLRKKYSTRYHSLEDEA